LSDASGEVPVSGRFEAIYCSLARGGRIQAYAQTSEIVRAVAAYDRKLAKDRVDTFPAPGGQ
jgi:hypothetical protein